MNGVTQSDGGRREARMRETRATIMNAALDMFDEVGFDDARTADIAERALVSEPTVFRYFPTKADLALAPLNELVDSIVADLVVRLETKTPYEAMLAITPGSLPDFDTLMARRSLVLCVSHTELAARVMWIFTDVVDRIRPVIAERRGVPFEDFDAFLTAQLVVTAVQVSLRYWFQAGCEPVAFGFVVEALETLRPQLDR